MCSLKQLHVEIIFPFQAANVAYFQRKIQLSGVSAYPDGSPSQLIRISGVLLYLSIWTKTKRKLHTKTWSRTFDVLIMTT